MNETLNKIVELYFEGHELKEILNSYKKGQKKYQRDYIKAMTDKMFEKWRD